MKSKPEVLVLGCGPAGMIAALEVSKHFRTTVLTRSLPRLEELPRVEAVPATLLALLIEYGIHPRRIGVDQLHEYRQASWENGLVSESTTSTVAHVERPALDLALCEALVKSQRVKIVLARNSTAFAEAIATAKRGKTRLIDATGRASLSAIHKIRPERPWAARGFLASRRSCAASQKFRIAALPDGFVYCIASANHVLLGLVGRGKLIQRSRHEITQHLSEHGASWVLEGLVPLAEMTTGSTSAASIQWGLGDFGMRIGDAALARDTLSSQGLACGMSEALYAAAIADEEGEHLFSIRQFEQRISHLRALDGLIGRCRFRDQPVWREYGLFTSKYLLNQARVPQIALRDGRLRPVPADATSQSLMQAN